MIRTYQLEPPLGLKNPSRKVPFSLAIVEFPPMSTVAEAVGASRSIARRSGTRVTTRTAVGSGGCGIVVYPVVIASLTLLLRLLTEEPWDAESGIESWVAGNLVNRSMKKKNNWTRQWWWWSWRYTSEKLLHGDNWKRLFFLGCFRCKYIKALSYSLLRKLPFSP